MKSANVGTHSKHPSSVHLKQFSEQVTQIPGNTKAKLDKQLRQVELEHIKQGELHFRQRFYSFV